MELCSAFSLLSLLTQLVQLPSTGHLPGERVVVELDDLQSLVASIGERRRDCPGKFVPVEVEES